MKPETLEKKSKLDDGFYKEYFSDTDGLLTHLETDDLSEEKLHECLDSWSELFGLILNDQIFQAKMYRGLGKFLKRANRRSGREPLTIKRMKSLNEDLKTLSEIFNI